MIDKELKKDNIVQPDSWTQLKDFTRARIALGNAGGSIPLKEVLSFQMAHAHAKDAVYAALQTDELLIELQTLNIPVYKAASKATTREEYLKRPDLGRSLNDASVRALSTNLPPADIVFILADGLSAGAVNKHATAILTRIYPLLQEQYSAAIVMVQQGRVAVGDEIGSLLQAKCTVLFIGERPGLSSPESMGIYTTYAPKKGLTDESRNCISNIHEEGLDYKQATSLLYYLVTQSFLRKESGVALKLDGISPLQLGK